MSYTLVSASNANVSIPAFPVGTQNPVTATFTVPNPGQSVDFTLRAASRVSAVLIRAQCGPSAAGGGAVSRLVPEASFWMPNQTAGVVDGLVSLVYYTFSREEAKPTE